MLLRNAVAQNVTTEITHMRILIYLHIYSAVVIALHAGNEPRFEGEKTMAKFKPEALLSAMAYQFPGLFNGKSDVNGGDLVEWLSRNIPDLKENLLRELQYQADMGAKSEEAESDLLDRSLFAAFGDESMR